MKHEQQLSELVRGVCEEALRRVRDDCARAPDDVAELLEVIAHGLFDPAFDIGTLRRRHEPSRATLWRFRTTLGCNPKAYLNLRRAEAAKRLVRSSEAPLGMIAESLGFADAELFSKWFKGQTGESPRQHRKTSRPAPARSAGAQRTIQRFRRLLLGDLDRDEAACWLRHLKAGGGGEA